MNSRRRNVVLPEGLTNRQWNTLATICLVLVVELSVATGLLLREMTGESWSVTSLALAFLLVSVMHEPLQNWIWGGETRVETTAENLQ